MPLYICPRTSSTHRFTRPAATAASTLYQQAIEYERQYHIRERMYAAMQEVPHKKKKNKKKKVALEKRGGKEK